MCAMMHRNLGQTSSVISYHGSFTMRVLILSLMVADEGISLKENSFGEKV